MDTSNENNKQLNESNNQMISQLRGIQDAIQSCDPNVTNALASPASYQDLLEFKRVVLQSLVNQNQSLLEMKTGQSMLDDKLRRLVTLVDEQLTALSQGVSAVRARFYELERPSPMNGNEDRSREMMAWPDELE